MSTFLELCQDLHREVGGAGSAPSAVTGQVGQSLRTVNWIKNAWIKIQNKHANWRWMRSEWSYSASSGNPYILSTYGLLDSVSALYISSRFARWILEVDEVPVMRTRLATSTGDYHFLTPLSWEDYRATYYHSGNTPDSGVPSFVSVDPQNRLRLALTPSDNYDFIGEYQKSPQILAADGDEPEMPDHFHELIVWEAMRRYARFVAAPEVYAHAKEEAGQMMRALEVDQLPPPKFAPPLA